jgi:hypothetical protein
MHRKTPERIDNRSSSKEPVVLLPTAGEKPLTEEDLEVLRRIGEHWAEVLGGQRISPKTLPVSPRSKFTRTRAISTDSLLVG